MTSHLAGRAEPAYRARRPAGGATSRVRSAVFDRRRVLTGVFALLTTLKLLTASVALAAFASTVTASQTVSTGTLVAPASATATNGTCSAGVSTRVNVGWVATTSAFADGYEVLRSTTSGGPYTSRATVSGVSTVSYVDTAQFSRTYYYVVKAKRNAWRSPDSNQAQVTTPSALCIV